MKLVIVITGLGTGGAEMMLLKLLEHIDRQRFSPHVISLTDVGEIGLRIRNLGIPVESLGMRPGFPNPLDLWHLVRLLRVIRPAMVHTMMYHANVLGGVAARIAGMSAISWGIRHSDLSWRGNKLATLAVAAVGARLSRWVPRIIMSCSDVARQVHVRHGYCAAKMVVLPNGFDISRFRPDSGAYNQVRQELGLHPDTQLVGLIGRFDPQKNHRGFFEAAHLLHLRLPHVHFVLAGKGVVSENSELMRMMDSTGLAGVTRLLGIRHDIPRLMAALDVLASSSIGEAFPNVVGEAMASGVPCAVTDVGDSAYIVGHTGRVVASKDMVMLAAAIEDLLMLEPRERRVLCERARARVIEHFEIGVVTRMYEQLFLNSLH